MTITAHDVRRMKVCSRCGQLGIYKPEHAEIGVSLVICTNGLRAPGRPADYQHPDCYIQGNSHRALLALPIDELGEIRMCDVSQRTMQAILAQGEHEKKSIDKFLEKGGGQ